MTVSLPATAALVTAALEYPVSQYYQTIPPTPTWQRMLIAGAMAYAAVAIAQQIRAR